MPVLCPRSNFRVIIVFAPSVFLESAQSLTSSIVFAGKKSIETF